MQKFREFWPLGASEFALEAEVRVLGAAVSALRALEAGAAGCSTGVWQGLAAVPVDAVEGMLSLYRSDRGWNVKHFHEHWWTMASAGATRGQDAAAAAGWRSGLAAWRARRKRPRKPCAA